MRNFRYGIIPATIVAFAALLTLAITVIHFHDAMLAEIARSLADGYLLHAAICLILSLLMLTCAGTLGTASHAWFHHRVRKAAFLTFVAPPAIVFLALSLIYVSPWLETVGTRH